MMNKSKSFLLMSAAAVGTMLLTSCLGESNNKYSNTSYFTVYKEGTGYVMYADGCGVVKPTQQSVSELTSGEGFLEGDRVLMLYQYTDDNYVQLAGKGHYINNAELVQGQRIPQENIITMAQAESDNVLAADSVFSLTENISSMSLWAYRGFLTASYSSTYSVVSNTGIYPTLYLIYDPAENGAPNTLNLKMTYNRHSSSSTQTGSQAFVTSYPLSSFNGFISGNDSITIKIDGSGLSSAKTLKIGREDLTPGNYLYY